ncbi:MAG: 50S ribosomal protein L6 [Dokdonella sp.]
MSRVAKKPVVVPKGVEVKAEAGLVTVKGPKGTLTQQSLPGVDVVIEDGEIRMSASNPDNVKMAGTNRALINSMVIGVTEGYARKLELVGVGYRAALQGKDLNLSLGFSHPVLYKAPEGITLEVPSQTEIWIRGSDKQSVGQVAAKIRGFRPPEPYKGKGVRYSGEKITIKEAKKA